MKSLCVCAAFAVATAVARGSIADATAQGKNLRPVFRNTVDGLTAIDGNKHCTEEINKWRKQVDPNAQEYQANTNGTPAQDIKTLITQDCSLINTGKYTHIQQSDSTPTAFVFSATRQLGTIRADMTCSEALEQWTKAFTDFEGKYPEKFKDGQDVYAKPNAVGLVSLLSEKQEQIYCGHSTGCGNETLICYIKPPAIKAGDYPVTAEMWHKVEESFSLKPKVTVLEAELQSYLEAVNDAREVDGLNLPKFTAASGKQRLRLKKSTPASTTYEDALYNITCTEIDDSSIDPIVEKEYTIIYAVKDGKTPPTAEEAVNFWKTGYDKLGPDVPPAFTTKGDKRDEAVDGGIYYNSAVAGFASLMVDTGRTMRCYSASGCKKAALICFLSEPTLVEGKKPISDDTWGKIVALANKVQVAKREEVDNCLKEINEFRTQDSLGLSAFVAKTPTSTDATDAEVAKYDAEELAKVVTCDGLKTGNASILLSSNKRSVMYYSGSSATCSNAVTEWKKGYEKFKDVVLPPKYTSSEDMYKTGAATNFISLVSEGDETVARCYTVTNCSEEGLVCVLEPAVFEEGKLPIKVVTWKKVTKTLGNGVSPPSVYGILLSSVLVVVGLFALNL